PDLADCHGRVHRGRAGPVGVLHAPVTGRRRPRAGGPAQSAAVPLLIGISNQTTLPFLVGREPHRLAIWSTRYSPRPPSSGASARRSRGRRRSLSKTSPHTAAAPRRSRSVNCLGGTGGASRSTSFSHAGGGALAPSPAPAGSSATRRRRRGSVVCRTT